MGRTPGKPWARCEVGVGTDGGEYVIPRRYWAWLGARRTIAVMLWFFAIGVGVHHIWHARRWLADGPQTPEPLRRADGGSGHTHIDFGGQWVMGRMLVLGHGRELYHRERQWEVVRAGFPLSDESQAQHLESHLPKSDRKLAGPDDDLRHDADRLMDWFMGNDKDPPPAIGGPLYPPVHAMLYAPIGLFDRPRTAYHVFQVFAVAVAYLAGLGIRVLTRGKIWWSVASAGILLFPGCRAALDLGQNPTLSLAILVWGWVLAARGRDWAGGAVWGLFGFKPVWAMAFFLVPLLMRRWRFCVAMVGTGALLGLATLPFVGIQSWFDWLKVGQEAAALYNVNHNWIILSRDLQGIPRRVLHNFNLPEAQRDTPLAKAIAWGLWGAVFATTVTVYLLRADRRRPIGFGAGFLFLGAFLTCYRFMYYDVLLAALPIAILFANPALLLRTRVFRLMLVPAVPSVPPLGREAAPPLERPNPFGPRLLGYFNSFPLTVLALLYFVDNTLLGMNLGATFTAGYWTHTTTAANGSTGIATPRVEMDTSLTYPWDTALLFTLWLWCAVRLVLKRECSVEILSSGGA